LSAQDDPLAWFPLQVGSRWIYEHEWRSGDRNRPDVNRWTTEEVITGWVTIPEGIVVLRTVKQQGNPDEKTTAVPVIGTNGELRQIQQPAYNRGLRASGEGEPCLVRGNCIYRIGGGWDSQKRELRPQYRRYLTDAELSPDFCFPLQGGGRWETAIFLGGSSRRARVLARFWPRSMRELFTYSPAISGAADGRMSGFEKASGS
jgi:hypothetical protein